MSEPVLATKSLDLRSAEFKAAEDGWSFKGYASTFGGEPDSYGDVVARGAFDRSLADNPSPPLLWSHSMADAIGKPTALESNRKGLYGEWTIVDHDIGTRAYKNLKAGIVNGLSIGFYAMDADEDDDTGIRTLTDVELVEISLVAVPANKHARVSAVKRRQAPTGALTADDVERFGKYLEEATGGRLIKLPDLDTDVKFERLFEQLATYYDMVAREAEALRDRRAQDERELSEGHVAALSTAIDKAEAFACRLAALRPSPTKAEAAATEDLSARLDATRRLLANDMAERRRRYAAAGYMETPK